MLDIKFIRDNLELVKTAAKNKNREVDWERLLQLDDKRRELIGKSETLRGERNKVSKTQNSNLPAGEAGPNDQKRGKEIKEELKKIEEELRSVEQDFTQLMYTVPNVPDKSVPVGRDSSGNIEIKKWGEPKPISGWTFQPKDHIVNLISDDYYKNLILLRSSVETACDSYFQKLAQTLLHPQH